MLDIRFIRENPELVQEKAKQKGYEVDVTQLLGFDKERSELLRQVEDLRRERNELAEKGKSGPPPQEDIQQGRELKDKLADLEHKLVSIEQELNTLLKKIPNMPLEQVPVGASEDENVIVREWGEKPQFDFEPKNHWQIAEERGLIDKERAAKVAGARFAYIKGDLVRLQFALVQFGLDTLTNEETIKKIVQDFDVKTISKPFIPVLPPAMARTEVYQSTYRLDQEEITYKLEGDDLWLNASAEHTLVPMYLNETIMANDLPLRYVGYTTAFRREAGTYGKDMEGIIRQHQFDKLEMESFTKPEDGLNEHLLMVAIQENFMQQLKLPYQVLEKCTADIGFANAKGVDIEVWLPGQNKYRETHTADFMADFQARSLKTRVKYLPDHAAKSLAETGESGMYNTSDVKSAYVHTSDATAFAMGRTLVAIIENYQNADGTIQIPEILQPYMGGQKQL
jgi:seryl-tRNA synthetase